MSDSMPAHLPYDRMAVLYTHDGAGRIQRINEPDGGLAPRFVFAQTVAGCIWRFRHDVPEAVVEQANALCASTRAAAIWHRPHPAEHVIELLDRHAPIEKVWAGPAFLFPDRLAPPLDTVAITSEKVSLLTPGFEEWAPDVATGQPFMAALVNGQAVSICCSVRVSPVVHEAGVETLPAARSAGHGTRAVTAWAIAVKRLEAVPVYSTAWDNEASVGLAKRLGLTQFGVDFHVT